MDNKNVVADTLSKEDDENESKHYIRSRQLFGTVITNIWMVERANNS